MEWNRKLMLNLSLSSYMKHFSWRENRVKVFFIVFRITSTTTKIAKLSEALIILLEEFKTGLKNFDLNVVQYKD